MSQHGIKNQAPTNPNDSSDLPMKKKKIIIGKKLVFGFAMKHHFQKEMEERMKGLKKMLGD